MATEHLSEFLQWLDRTLASESLVALPDHQLLERFLIARDNAAFHVLVSRHGPMVFRVCRRVLSDEKDTEDAFQAAFLILIRKAGTIRKRMSLACWLHGVAYQVALRVRTSSQRRRIRETQMGIRDEATAKDDRSWTEVRAIVDEELAGLPERLRAPLVLCYLEGLTQDEAAEQLGQSKRTLRRYLERGREILGTRLIRRGLGLSGALMTTLFSDCVEALPPRLKASTELVGEAISAEASGAISHSVATLANEVIRKMSPSHMNMKWAAAALLGLGFGSLAIGSLFAESQSHEIPQFGRAESASTPVGHKPAATNFGISKQSKSVEHGMSLDIIKAWEDAEARFGCFVKVWDGYMFFHNRLPSNGELPAFYVTDDVKYSKLPAPNVPFGLVCRKITSASFKELATLEQLQMLELGDTGIQDADLKELAPLQKLQWLSLIDTQVTDAGLKELTALKQLQTLELDRTRVTDAGMKELTACKQLRTLELAGVPVTDVGLKEISKLAQLEILRLNGNPVTDNGIKELAALKQLRMLELSKTQVTEAGLKELATLTQLQTLSLSLPQFTDLGLKELAALKQLQTLELSNSQVTEAGMRELGKLSELQKLTLRKVSLHEGGVKYLAPLKKLRTLEMFFTQVTDAGSKELATLTQLQRLELTFTQITDAGAKEVAALKQLQELRLLGKQNPITDAGIKELAALKELKKLEFLGPLLTDTGIKELTSLKKLKELVLYETQLTESGLKELTAFKQLEKLAVMRAPVTEAVARELSSLKQLQMLCLPNCSVTDSVAKELAALKQLQILDLRQTQVTDVSVKELATLQQLQILELQGTPVTDDGVKELRKALPLCRIYK